jgi:UDP-N-acetylmuramyl pentapeptide phosphotransferase/UDP-N-acetylglucosamine-1-phosphate transferase
MVPVLIAGLLAMVAAIVIGPKFIERLRARNLGQQSGRKARRRTG